MKALIGAKILTQEGILDKHVLLFDETISEIMPEAIYAESGRYTRETVEETTVKGLLVPGFIDIHIHGSSGYDVMDGTQEALKVISNSLLKSGTTAFLATTMTMSQMAIEQSLSAIKLAIETQSLLLSQKNAIGARILGAHLEGPFINPQFKGAQNIDFIQKPTREWLDAHLETIKMITYAPEMDDDFAFAKSMKDTDVVLSIGHSGCDYETAALALNEGVDHITHCFNAMSGLHHRKPGIVGAALTLPFTIDIITDGIHVHPKFMGPFIELKGIDKTVLITDAMRAAMMPEGSYELGGQKVVVNEGCCRLEDGTLAGSVLTMDEALRNLLNHSTVTLPLIVQMLSENPAKKLGIFDKFGSISPGKQADIVILNDDNRVVKVFIGGILNYSED